jgi:DNA-binding NarL/FixJ family response regulator
VAEEALALGALGYVVKIHAGIELLAAVEAVCQGRRFVSAALAGHVPAEGRRQGPKGHPGEALAPTSEAGD